MEGQSEIERYENQVELELITILLLHGCICFKQLLKWPNRQFNCFETARDQYHIVHFGQT